MSAYKNQEPTATAYAYEPGSSQQQQQTANHQEDQGPKIGSKRQVRGAAVAGGLTGLVLIGPAAGLLAAGGAVLATGGKGDVGKAARTTGDSISDLGRSLKKFERKHSIKEKTTTGIVKGCDWVSKRLSKDKGSNMLT